MESGVAGFGVHSPVMGVQPLSRQSCVKVSIANEPLVQTTWVSHGRM